MEKPMVDKKRRLVSQTLILASLVGLSACDGSGGGGLPPEAFGAFEDTNDAVFVKRLEMTANAVSHFIGVNLPGVRQNSPTVCRAEVPAGLSSAMDLTLDCDGTEIPFRFEYRSDREDWVVWEEDSAPSIFSRRRI
jgi:hypothetical protein